MGDAEIVGGYESASSSMGSYSSRSMNLGMEGISIRSVYQPIMALEGLGIHIDMNSQLMKALRTVVITNYSLLILQGAYRSIVKAQTARELALATGETTAMAIAQQWHTIAMAAGAAILVGATLGIGYAVGEKFGSGDWNLPGGNLSVPQERRQMEHALAGTGVRRRG